MSLYENWLIQAYNRDGHSIPALWDKYMPLEQKIYEDIIGNKIEKIDATVSELSTKYNMSNEFICGFLDGINDSIDNKTDMESIQEDTKVSFKIDFEKLYKKMVEYKAQHLIELEQWDSIFDIQTREAFYKEQKISRTYVADKKVSRNEPCPCGSGKKYKHCCGA